MEVTKSIVEERWSLWKKFLARSTKLLFYRVELLPKSGGHTDIYNYTLFFVFCQFSQIWPNLQQVWIDLYTLVYTNAEFSTVIHTFIPRASLRYALRAWLIGFCSFFVLFVYTSLYK